METKKCDHCGRTVLANSKVCKHCGQSFVCEDIVLDETVKTESEQLQTSQSIESEKNEDTIQQSIDNAQPLEEIRKRKKWYLLAIVGIFVVSFSIYWISRTHGEEVSAVIKIEEESELKNNEDEPEMKENIEFIAPELSSDKEEKKEERKEDNEISFTLSAPKVTVKGGQIRIQYILMNDNEATNIQVPDKISGFEIKYGPSVSQNYTSRFVNGVKKTEESITHSYVLMATTEGVFKLPAATIKCKGRIYTSNTALIKVLPSNDGTSSKNHSSSNSKYIKITPNDVMQNYETAIDIKELSDNKKTEIQLNDKRIYNEVEVMPSFPGGESALSQFISANLRYPVVAQESGIQGRAIIRFVVTRTGSTSDVIVVRGFDPSCDKEAVRVVKAMPKWNPGIQDGNPVDVYFTLPISFTLTRNY